MSRRQAIDIAMDALSKPGITSFLTAGPLPEGLKSLLRIVAEGEWRDASTEHAYRRHGAETVRAASAAFLAAVLFARQSDPYRVLGLPTGAPLSEVRENKRLLLKWLHPDRNPEAPEQENLSRVVEAADAIEEGRIEAFIKSARRQAFSPSPSVPRSSLGQGGTRTSSRGGRKSSAAIAQAARAGARRWIPGMLRAAGLSVLAAAILVSGLATWRYVMQEPIGASLSRYSKAAMGIVAWP